MLGLEVEAYTNHVIMLFVGTARFHEAEKPVYQTEQARPHAYKGLTPFGKISDQGDKNDSHSLSARSQLRACQG